jgi:hypothetical protein
MAMEKPGHRLGAASCRRLLEEATSMREHKLLIAVISFGLTWAGIVKAEDQPIEQQLVDAMNKIFGVHPGFRANHAKGIVAEGNLTAKYKKYIGEHEAHLGEGRGRMAVRRTEERSISEAAE